jgi:hypothetical protein
VTEENMVAVYNRCKEIFDWEVNNR